MTKTYNAAGVSRVRADQPLKIRMATDIEWRKFDLARAGHVDVTLIELGAEMTKTDAVVALAASAQFAENTEAQEVFTAYLMSKGVIERPKKPRGRPAKAKVAEQVAEPVAETTAELQPSQELIDAVTETMSETAVESQETEFEPNF
jgi:phenylpyruvate tautomerase PptA (4-oxalocrotonate tautomerase family)